MAVLLGAAAGACTTARVPVGVFACSASDQCATGYLCQGGVCRLAAAGDAEGDVPADVVVPQCTQDAACQGLPDAEPCKKYACESGACVVSGYQVDGTGCGAGGGPCTQKACASGECAVEQPIAAGGACALEGGCRKGVCDAEGHCVVSAERTSGDCDTDPADPCNGGTCTAAGRCEMAPKEGVPACDLDGEICTTGRCVDGECIDGADAPICDAYVCRVHACIEATHQCTAELQPGWCFDADLQAPCFREGQAHPQNPCDVCRPDPSGTSWGFALEPDGAACAAPNLCAKTASCAAGKCVMDEPAVGAPCDDGIPCTHSDACDTLGECHGKAYACTPTADCVKSACNGQAGAGGLGECEETPTMSTCYIDGVCAGADSTNPANACQACSPLENALGWTTKTDGDLCDDGDLCTDDVCMGGLCVLACDDGVPCTGDVCGAGGGCSYPVAEGSCLIEKKCIAAGESRPGQKCEVCDPAVDQQAWTLLVGCVP